MTDNLHSGLCGVVLAAGRSTRMGTDKALLEVGGKPLWQRQRDLLRRAGAKRIYLSARPDQAWARDAAGFEAVLHDALPNCGPMVGITSALERSSDPWLAVLAVDLPAMTAEWFSSLWADRGTSVGVIGRRGEFFEPLAALYPQEVKWLAWEAIGRGDYSLQRLAQAAIEKGLLRVREIRGAEEALFENWNAAVGEKQNR